MDTMGDVMGDDLDGDDLDGDVMGDDLDGMAVVGRRVIRARTGAMFGSDCGSTRATRAPELSSRYSSASAPNRNDSGTAIAPIW